MVRTEKHVTTTVYLRRDQLEALRGISEASRVPQAALIREGVDLILKRAQEADFASFRVCPICGEFKPGWPDAWRNVPPPESPRGLRYACGDCVLKASEAPGT